MLLISAGGDNIWRDGVSKLPPPEQRECTLLHQLRRGLGGGATGCTHLTIRTHAASSNATAGTTAGSCSACRAATATRAAQHGLV